MSNFNNVTRLGQANNTGSNEALFYERFSGRVDALFREQSKFIDRVATKEAVRGNDTISFDIHGILTGQYHAIAGEEIDPGQLALNKRSIGIDRPFWSGFTVDDGDRYVKAWQPDAEGVMETVSALTINYDKVVAQVITKAARSAGFVTGQDGGTSGGRTAGAGGNDAWNTAQIAGTLDNGLTTGASNASEWFTAIERAALVMDNKFIPEDSRYLAISPTTYHLLYPSTQGLQVMNRDYGGNGSLQRSDLRMIANFMLVKSTHLPSTDITSAPTGVHSANQTARTGDYTPTLGVAWHPQAIGCAISALPFTERSRQHRNFVDLFTTSYVMGHNVLRPECAVEITDKNLNAA